AEEFFYYIRAEIAPKRVPNKIALAQPFEAGFFLRHVALHDESPRGKSQHHERTHQICDHMAVEKSQGHQAHIAEGAPKRTEREGERGASQRQHEQYAEKQHLDAEHL